MLAKKLLMGTSGTVGVLRLLVLLCFFLSMVITNDVALITFVPLALIIVHKLPKELTNYWLLKIVAMQTIAANLGSMLTPIGTAYVRCFGSGYLYPYQKKDKCCGGIGKHQGY